MKKLLLIVLLALAFGAQAQNTLSLKEGEKPQARLADVAWISGCWRGEAMGGQTEEIWARPSGGSMMGSFKLMEQGKVVFYELCTITEVEGSLLLRIKHFSATLEGWEEKEKSVEFPLVKLTADRAYFEGLTFERVGADTLTIYVGIEEKEGQAVEVKFPYTRAEL
ncbi:DUF6265 family protein [Cytophagales bacterium LB-30]|uniref:DUF6265 family protein n=1 Tax=Shiella aurantiaca TaxID=3058365 RepID=A0ABT8F666_9BACT|nr:DUF6265 family protein [Shiella aurantiaca]MDN4165744.1 DUF6265 family protein [Shiella aurantiaca]